MNTPELNKIIEIVREAGNIVTEGASLIDIRQKGDSDFVTDSDFAVQQFIKGRLFELYPNIDFLAEEEPDHAVEKSGLTWILDPIDGTMNFIRDIGFSAISLALTENGNTVMGVVYNPFRNEMFYAESKNGAYLNGHPIQVSSQSELSGALAAIGTAPYYKPAVGECFEIYRELFLSAVDIRRVGSAALDICYVAAGRFDCYYEYILSIWDYAAARLILTEAGGTITNTAGLQTLFEKKSPIIATNGKLHGAVLDIVNAHTIK